MTGGWLKLHRKSTRSRVFQNDSLWKLWTWCLMRANFETEWATIRSGRGSTEVEVGPGQFIFGRKSAARELKMKPSTLWKRMLKLKSIGNLNIESNTQYSLVTIVNWDSYQGHEEKRNTESDSQGTAKEQPSDSQVTQVRTIRTIKNEKNTPPLPPHGGEGARLYDFYLQKINPERKSRQRAVANANHYLRQYPFEDLHKAVENYASEITTKGTGRQYRKDPANFFGKKDPAFVDYVPGVFDLDAIEGESTDDLRERYARVARQVMGTDKQPGAVEPVAQKSAGRPPDI